MIIYNAYQHHDVQLKGQCSNRSRSRNVMILQVVKTYMNPFIVYVPLNPFIYLSYFWPFVVVIKDFKSGYVICMGYYLTRVQSNVTSSTVPVCNEPRIKCQRRVRSGYQASLL